MYCLRQASGEFPKTKRCMMHNHRTWFALHDHISLWLKSDQRRKKQQMYGLMNSNKQWRNIRYCKVCFWRHDCCFVRQQKKIFFVCFSSDFIARRVSASSSVAILDTNASIRISASLKKLSTAFVVVFVFVSVGKDNRNSVARIE